MIYFTQLIYVVKGREEVFNEFEDHVLPLLQKHNGKLVQRWRCHEASVIHTDGDTPYEIHLVSFDNESSFNNYIHDPERKQYLHLKETSVERSILIKGHQV